MGEVVRASGPKALRFVAAASSKAQHSPTEDRWAALYNFQYVREFLALPRVFDEALGQVTRECS